MASRIHRLDSLTIDKIAAGEVIEAPSSCVKELIDNALDAEASEILIEIVLGGRELIRIVDNGLGMSKEDVIASIERHSTSKIKTVEDLEHLILRGFRGEALSSIVSISHVSITSAEAAGRGAATTLTAEGGLVKTVLQTTGNQGTTVEVKSLFYNVPARRKFLKSPQKDLQDILKIVTLLALSAPSVGFRLIADGKQVLSCPISSNVVSRIRTLFKEPFQGDSFEIHYEREGCAIHGVIASPQHARSTRSAQYLIVNGRPVHSLPVSYAVKNGYGTAIDQTKHPAFALHITLDTSSVDINVHPQKKEVRLADEEWVKIMIQEAVSEVLFGQQLPLPKTENFFHTPFIDQPRFTKNPPYMVEETLFPLKDEPLKVEQKYPLIIIGDVAIFQNVQLASLQAPRNTDHMLFLDLKQAMRTICLIDLEKKTKKLVTDLLLVPFQIDCSTSEATQVCAKMPMLEALGFVIRLMGPSTFVVEGVPSHLIDVDIRKLIFDIIQGDEKTNEQKNKRAASLFTASMNCLRSPISNETAKLIFTTWVEYGCPKIAPDGSFCCSYFDGPSLKGLVAKQGLSV